MSASGTDLVAQRLRELDRERYFATLFLPAAARHPIQALYAVAAELAVIAARVTNPAAGEIRLQWWIDALEGEAHGEIRQNPLAEALLEAMAAHQWPVGPLVRLAEARRFDLYNDPMPDWASFEGYAGETVSVLYQLAAMLLHGGPVDASDAAGHLGVAQAVVGHLRAMGYHAARGHIFLPWAIFAANGVDKADFLAGRSTPGVLAARAQLCELAGDHLRQARRAMAALPHAIRPAFIVSRLLAQQLADLDRMATQPFAPPPERSDLAKLTLLALARFGRL